MVKTVLGVNHQGLTDWLIQRVSAIVMAVYSIGLFGFFFTHSNLTFEDWHGLFANMWMKVATLLLLLSLLFHAWIGMWTIFTDYVKPFVVRLILHVIVLLALIAFFFEGALILWSV
jgi:succinate dehydrogenase / fumarate reductase membrane anchor subunit